MHALLNSIGAHRWMTLTVVFSIACAASIAIVGMPVPAGIVKLVAGALIGLGLDARITLAVAALGAIAGDSISHELGRRYHDEVQSWCVRRGHHPPWHVASSSLVIGLRTHAMVDLLSHQHCIGAGTVTSLYRMHGVEAWHSIRLRECLQAAQRFPLTAIGRRAVFANLS
ncbi:hypothetical protein BN2475_680004 [Paraburkholderia ribeironis]|uniref:Uncharacterized protein n=1 Tax=Paraburkholderia ribeironis TaxID=1247936 RepID=A0A1N7SGT2_9BURK|nr:hypothetical protein [Paraburkholderia ribeironis]SIT46621.1 hypothetical protein BN2475_680004 [Paraburkholderia ribeironis]